MSISERLFHQNKPRCASFSVLNKYTVQYIDVFLPPRGCLSCSFRKTGYYSQPLIASKSAGPEVDVLSGFHCTAPIESIVIHALPISSSVSWAVTPGRVHLSRPIAFPIALPHTIPLIRGNIPI